MPTGGWKQLLKGWPWYRGEGSYPIAAYSEFMPPPRLVRKPYGTGELVLLREDDPFGWPVTEYEEQMALQPGLRQVAQQLVTSLVHLGQGRAAHGIAGNKLADNPYWPPQLADRAGRLKHERYVVLAPLALSRTQDDKGRVRWTLLGGSEQGPARAFWRSFYLDPRHPRPAEEGLAFLRRLLHQAYGEPDGPARDLHAAGLRILPVGKPSAVAPSWDDGPLPAWTRPLLWNGSAGSRGVRYVLTFRPFAQLPANLRRAYLDGKVHLLPFPGSLLYWGPATYRRLADDLENAIQIPLLHSVARHEGPHGLRVPQSGWLHEPRPGRPEPDAGHGPFRNTYKRTHRWARVHRDEDELAVTADEDKLMHVLFSTAPEDMGLYGKPMARNSQIWTDQFRLLLDGPHALREDIGKALHTLHEGGIFGYRFYYPPMRVGRHELVWHRPLAAYLGPNEQPELLSPAPAGYLTATPAEPGRSLRPLELWPRFLHRDVHVESIELFRGAKEHRPYQTIVNVRKLFDTFQLLGERPLPRLLARRLVTCAREKTLDDWLDGLPGRSADAGRGRWLVEELRRRLEPARDTPPRRTAPPSLTFDRTARRAFETTYWKTIAFLAEGRYLNKNNADCVRDPATQAALMHHHRDLEALGNYLVTYYTERITQARLRNKALVGDLPFAWRTDFEFSAFGGWLNSQAGDTHERDVIVVIPGRDRRRAVIMADHYDTAYMADHYEKEYGGDGARVAAAGADDNHSATAALMLGAPVFLDLSRRGELDCDIWLIHLTGEEFPADCLGARHLTQQLVEGTLRLRLPNGRWHDLSGTRVQGVYVLDMVAHNNDHDRDVFQISPGASRESMWLAYQAAVANDTWNCGTEVWNRKPSRRGTGRSPRMKDGKTVPSIAPHPVLHGEVRPHYDPRSTLYNTDGQIFSDAGVPVVLFMENYDINRTGYHDSHDTMENIDLDYGAGVAAIAIESVARAATERPEEESHG